MKFSTFLFMILFPLSVCAQENNALDLFWNNILQHCGKSYEGTITEGAQEGDGFSGNKLIMRVIKCSDNQIKIPFFVGEDKSRTWILTRKDDRLELKHDHRHKDGSEDSVTMYGGTTTNSGWENMQVFPADPFTCELISYACANVWWITIDENAYTYNLRRIGTDRLFTVRFDLSKPILFSDVPWGWKE